MNADKILIRGPNWVGDSVLAIPAMKAVRAQFPKAEITLLVRPWVAGLFTSAPFIDRVWTEPRPTSVSDWSRITHAIREKHFDLGVLFPNSFESALMLFLGRVSTRVGYAADGRSLLLTSALSPSREIRHQVHYYMDLVEKLRGLKPTDYNRNCRSPLASAHGVPSIEIRATEEERSEARQLLNAEGIGGAERILILNPGAAYGSAKRWDEARFAEVADRLSTELALRTAIIGSASELPVARKVQSLMKTSAAVLNGKTTLETLIGLLAETTLMITNDSGPMHIAAALGTPTVAVFGSTDERTTAPFAVNTKVVKKPVPCSPCLLRECPIDHRCMTGVTVNDVCHAARELMAHA